MKIKVPCQHTKELRVLFQDIGEPIRFVGGCVRDTIAGEAVKDIDLATPALPQTVLDAAEHAGYRVIPTGLQHGTVTVVIDGEGYEITTLRADVETDGRHATVAYVTDFETDAARRDFTFNAMSADLDGNVFDYFGGQEDLSARRVVFVGDLNARITEDYLRILRFYRFKARYGGGEPLGYEDEIGKHANGLYRISGERIWSELSRILVSEGAYMAVKNMERTNVLATTGLTINSDQAIHRAFTCAHHASGRAAVLLGIIARDESNLEAVTDRWRVSSSDKELACMAHAVRREIESDFSRERILDRYFWINKAIDGIPLDDLRSAIGVAGMGMILSDFPEQVPVFPVKGQDLLDMGMKPGREVGELLRAIKDEWKRSRYELGREELIATLSVPEDTVGGMRP